MAGHGVSFYEDDMGFWYGVCLCKWRSAPMPDREDVADAYGDHRAAQALVEWEASRAD